MRLKNLTKLIKDITKTLVCQNPLLDKSLESKNALVGSAIANNLIDHGRSL